MDRIKKLCGYLTPCGTFADVGCDHGYCAEYMLKNSLCERAVISDISGQCLAKAEKLLQGYIKSGKCTPVCCFGLEKIDPSTDLTLIAGMGGEEIISVLGAAYIPSCFVLQPMKNVSELRRFLISRGACITRDDVFFSGGKYYFVLCGKSTGGTYGYTPAQLLFGRGDISGDLGGYLKEELKKKTGYLNNTMNEQSRKKLTGEISFIQGVLSGEIK